MCAFHGFLSFNVGCVNRSADAPGVSRVRGAAALRLTHPTCCFYLPPASFATRRWRDGSRPAGLRGLPSREKPAASAERAVVHAVMLALRPVADVPHANIDETLIQSQFQDTLREVALKKIGEQRENVKTHGKLKIEN